MSPRQLVFWGRGATAKATLAIMSVTMLMALMFPCSLGESESVNPDDDGHGHGHDYRHSHDNEHGNDNGNGNGNGNGSVDSSSSSGPFKNFRMGEPDPSTGPANTAKSRSGRSVCKISEFPCRTGKCIPSDRYCDGIDNCGDLSDEPRWCTPCNRTYYGEVGQTYSISLSSATIAAALGLSHEQQLQQGDDPLPPTTLPLGAGSGGTNASGKGHKGQSLKEKLKTVLDLGNKKVMMTGTTKKPSGTISVLPPQFVCQLTFAAAGDNFGDMIQVMLDSVNIGHFASPTHDGCPDGSLQVAEINRPLPGGKWCGQGQGYGVYFSETSAIALTLSVTYANGLRLSNSSSSSSLSLKGQGQDSTKMMMGMKPSSADDFEFKMRFKFIPRSLSTVRFGTHWDPVERGEVVPGSYCSRDFESCHRRRCKLQSPNFPGLYPPNIQCSFTIRHYEKLPCKHVLIQVGQSRGHKVQLKSTMTMGGRPSSPGGQGGLPQQQSNLLLQEDALMAWEDCSLGNRDTLTIYDGTSTADPVLLVLCGGNHVPPVTSSAPELLVVFRATPFGNPLDPRPSPPFPEPLRGFELDVDVVMVDSDSAEYSNFKENCTFFFISEPRDKCLFKPQEKGGNWVSGRRGRVTNPRHTIPPNTTCRYEFKGTEHEVVWVYFASYSRAQSKDPNSKQLEGNCTSRLTIRDGIDSRNEVLLGNYCDTDLPKLCDHKALQNESRAIRSCTDQESYISAGPRLIMEQGFFEGTALRPINFVFYYEFVSRHSSGSEGGCNRHYKVSKMKGKGVIRTSDNVFDFGRGGKGALTCSYTFTMGSYEGIRLTVKNASFGDRPCRTVTDYETGRHLCNYIAQSSPNSGTSSSNIGATQDSNSNNSLPFHQSLGGGEGGYPSGIPPKSELTLTEYIWPNANVSAHQHCICSNFSGNSGPVLTFLGRKVVLTFTIDSMSSKDSYENFFVHLEYEVLKDVGCRGDNHHMTTESGIISLESVFAHGPKVPSCPQYPWLLEAKQNHSLYLRIPGYPMIEEKFAKGPGQQVKPTPFVGVVGQPQVIIYNETIDNLTSTDFSSKPKLVQYDKVCPTTRNRIFIYDGNNKLVQKICPSFTGPLSMSPAPIVEVYSEDFGKFHSPLFPPPKTRFVIEFVGRELGAYNIKWLELISAKMKTTLKAMENDPGGNINRGISGANGNVSISAEQDKLRRASKPSWDETLAKLFEGQDDGDPSSPGTGDWGTSLPYLPLGIGICSSYCPELKACISDKLWCDGEIHCPITEADEAKCDNFWLTLNQLLSPAVYIPLIAAALSALCCCGLVLLVVAVKRMVINMRSKGQLNLGHPPSSSVASSRTSTVERRLPPRDYFYDPHVPVS